ncbi:MAG: class A beta-lactamase [Rhodocyclaceae bacterium]
MSHSPHRRALILAGSALPLSLLSPAWASAPATPPSATARLAMLEASEGGRLGVSAIDTGSGRRVDYRSNERFAMCSTFKVMLAGAILHRSTQDAGLLERVLRYTRADLVTYSPITEKHLDSGLRVTDLCAAALQYSDNTAGNLLLRQVGGPAGLTAYARRLADPAFRLDRWETILNEAVPGDERDTTTPAAMAGSLRRLALGDALPATAREQLQRWLQGNTTGAGRIREGVPADWRVGDKTGSGDYGTTNDVAVLWPAHGAPIVLTVYSTQARRDAPTRTGLVAAATRIVVDALS